MRSWQPSYNLIAQLSHFGWGALFITTSQAMLGGHFIGGLALLSWAILKEFVFDILVERASWANSAADFAWYVIGAMVALVLLWIKVILSS